MFPWPLPPHHSHVAHSHIATQSATAHHHHAYAQHAASQAHHAAASTMHNDPSAALYHKIVSGQNVYRVGL